jgi:4-amino-4-deoxy-L-arabinose transferase-like glycosyltransferase
VGLALRLLYVTVVAPAPVGLDGDWHFYSSAADLIAQGHFYYRGIFHRAFSTAEHPPLYPLVLGAAVWLGAKGVLAQRIVSCALGSAAVVLFGMLGRRVAGDRVGLAAAGLAAVYPPLIVVDGALDSEPLMVVGLLACLLLVYRLRERPTPRHAALLGAVLGLTTLAHTAAVLLVPLLLVPVAWRPRGGRGTRTCAALAAFAAVIAP